MYTYIYIYTESAIQQVEKDLKIPVLSIVRLKHLVSYISGLENTDKNLLNSIVDYRSKYGVEY
jgi:orotate phosphoribosyltransferase